MNGFDDFDTQVTAEEYYDRDDMSCEYDTDAPMDTDRIAQAEEFYDGWAEDEADYYETWRDEQMQEDTAE